MYRSCRVFHQGLKERLVEKGKLCATLFQGHMGGFTKKKNGVEADPPKLEREQVQLANVHGRRRLLAALFTFRSPCSLLGGGRGRGGRVCPVRFSKYLRRLLLRGRSGSVPLCVAANSGNWC